MEAATGRGINRCSRQTDIEACPPVPVGNHLALQPETQHTPSPDAKSSGPDHSPLPELNVEPFPKRKQNVPAALKLGATSKPFKHCLAKYPTRTLEATPINKASLQVLSEGALRTRMAGRVCTQSTRYFVTCPHAQLNMHRTLQGQAC